ncbi:MAG: hypothetical protein ACE5JI_08725 [Acidobacteriota bacterium]
MNRKQRQVLTAYLVALAVLGFLWVPWTVSGISRGLFVENPLGERFVRTVYRPLFLPPPGSEVGVDLPLLAAELIIVTMIAFGVLFALQRKR